MVVVPGKSVLGHRGGCCGFASVAVSCLVLLWALIICISWSGRFCIFVGVSLQMLVFDILYVMFSGAVLLASLGRCLVRIR